MVLHAKFRALLFIWRQCYLLFMESLNFSESPLRIIRSSSKFCSKCPPPWDGEHGYLFLDTWPHGPTRLRHHLIEILAVMFICLFFGPRYRRGKTGWPIYKTTNYQRGTFYSDLSEYISHAYTVPARLSNTRVLTTRWHTSLRTHCGLLFTGKSRESASKYATAASFEILSILLFIICDLSGSVVSWTPTKAINNTFFCCIYSCRMSFYDDRFLLTTRWAMPFERIAVACQTLWLSLAVRGLPNPFIFMDSLYWFNEIRVTLDLNFLLWPQFTGLYTAWNTTIGS
jgi:hypothetical protein